MFVVGTLLQNVVVIDLAMVTRAMELAGAPDDGAPGLLAGLRAVGWVFLVGNALGMLAPFGVGPIPPEVFAATVDVHGPAGLLPTLVTDGGAVLLVVALLVFRGRWSRDTKNQNRLIGSEVRS